MAKAFVVVRGQPLFDYSLRSIEASGVAGSTVLVVPEREIGRAGELLAEVGRSSRVDAVVAGGATRQESVRLGLKAIPGNADLVICHDAARPLASPQLFRRVVEALRTSTGANGVVPVIPSMDTVKRIRDGRVVETIPRGELGLAQTPQSFKAGALREAHARALGEGFEGTDDAMLLEAAGFVVTTAEGEVSNFKVTSPADLWRAEQILVGREDRSSMARPHRASGASSHRPVEA